MLHPDGTDESGAPTPLSKSYSPISHPSAERELQLLVKAYAPRAGGGVGAFLCALRPGEHVFASVKPPRVMHGGAAVRGRWVQVGLLAGGTGIAPLYQLARILLDDANERARVRVLSVNRREEDTLLRAELDALAAAHPNRLSVAYSLTQPPSGWGGLTGRGSVAMARAALPPPRSTGGASTMVFVCGRDGFVESWAGAVGRAPKKPDGTRGGKVQGPLRGLLAAAGYEADEVFKY